MTLKQMDSFRLVYELRNVSQASAMAFLSPQAVSKNIQHLEEDLGVTLFVRSSKGMEPTKAADYLYEEIGKIQEILTRIPEGLQTLRGERVVVHVGIGFSVLLFLGLQLLRDYETQNPEILIKSEDRIDEELERRLYEGTYQMVLTIGPLDTRKFENYPLKKDQMCLGILPGDPLYNKEDLTLEDLDGRTVISCSRDFRAHYDWEWYQRARGIKCKETIALAEIQAQRQMAGEIGGLLLAPRHLLAAMYPELRPMKLPDLYWQVVLAVRRDTPLTWGAERLRTYIVDSFTGEV